MKLFPKKQEMTNEQTKVLKDITQESNKEKKKAKNLRTKEKKLE